MWSCCKGSCSCRRSPREDQALATTRVCTARKFCGKFEVWSVFRGGKKKETEKGDRNNEQVQSAVAQHSEGEASASVREAPSQIGSTFSQDLSEARSPLFVRQEEAETREEMAQGVYPSESPPPSFLSALFSSFLLRVRSEGLGCRSYLSLRKRVFGNLWTRFRVSRTVETPWLFVLGRAPFPACSSTCRK
jgi:hypothetical protein